MHVCTRTLCCLYTLSKNKAKARRRRRQATTTLGRRRCLPGSTPFQWRAAHRPALLFCLFLHGRALARASCGCLSPVIFYSSKKTAAVSTEFHSIICYTTRIIVFRTYIYMCSFVAMVLLHRRRQDQPAAGKFLSRQTRRRGHRASAAAIASCPLFLRQRCPSVRLPTTPMYRVAITMHLSASHMTLNVCVSRE